jgi:hypothetical protein
VNRIPGVTLDNAGFVHTQFGSYHPVTGQGLPIDAPEALMRGILLALINDGLASPIDEELDVDDFMERKFSSLGVD